MSANQTSTTSASTNTGIDWRQVIVPAVVSILFFTLLTGLLYPAVITGIAQVVFPNQANGSLIEDASGNVIGSELIGQQFSDPVYFWGRLSATGPVPYNGAISSGSNYGPLNPALIGEEGTVQSRITALEEANAAAGVSVDTAIPVDLVTASGSGLDPHISPAAAQYQLPRVAALRGIDETTLQALVDEFTEGRTLLILGEPRVNVLRLNLALDEQYPVDGGGAAVPSTEAEATAEPTVEVTPDATAEGE
ncbi:MAG: potassium-transporting ATPase subunit KdpC [bacterium]|nr:potassium-transporting ATPase subunit KdpC [bacterium]